jgi:Uma2 family endonuclease
MAVSPRQKLTYEEWLDFPTPEGLRTELIDGEVSVAPEPTYRHQVILVNLLVIFRNYLDVHGGGMVLPPVNVRLADDQGFGPDAVFVHEWGDDPLTYHGPPPLVIEIVSDPRRDLRIKRDRYERYGVPEYWAVLPEAEQIQVFRLLDGRYGTPVVHEAPGTISALALPDLVISVADVFAG